MQFSGFFWFSSLKSYERSSNNLHILFIAPLLMLCYRLQCTIPLSGNVSWKGYCCFCVASVLSWTKLSVCRDIKDTTVGTLSQRITNQVHGLKGLNSKLLDIRAYLERVASGKLPINHQIIYHLQDVFNLLPDVNLLVRYKSQTRNGSFGINVDS